ncbi:response regulator transcription factor [Nocardioides sp. SYSU DS0663]|uniref:response regulator transcription factor n=1 Tax=Nocardioides sp. SYSU DS0663 TaxID=3416445 RepID=UPI003F4B7346
MARVLVAEADDDIRDLIVWLLERDGHEVDAVADGTTALEHWRRSPAELAVLDARMAGLDGVEVARTIRRHGTDQAQQSRPAIVLLSTSLAADDVERGLAAGADEYVGMPFRVRELGRTIGRLLEGDVA